MGDESLDLEQFRDYLKLIATLELGERFRSKVDPSDIVQETLLKAHSAREQWRGETSDELLVWLRSILARTLLNVRRDLLRGRRDVRRERSLEASIERSTRRFFSFAGVDSSPSVKARRGELLLSVSRAVAGLPDDQRQAFLMKHWGSSSVQEIADEMGKTVPSVAGLLRRSMKTVRDELRGFV